MVSAELAKLLLLRARKEEWIGVLLSLRIGGGGGGIDDWEAANFYRVRVCNLLVENGRW